MFEKVIDFVGQYKKAVIGAIIIIASLLFWFFQGNLNKSTPTEMITLTEMSSPEESDKFVDLKGAVAKPGVYVITPNMRLADVLEIAGGLTAEADNRVINESLLLTDQQLIYIPKKGEVAADFIPGLSSESTDEQSNKININEADEAALVSLPGVGPAKAQAIISYREEHGNFKKTEDLKNVSGFGEKTVERLLESIKV